MHVLACSPLLLTRTSLAWPGALQRQRSANERTRIQAQTRMHDTHTHTHTRMTNTHTRSLSLPPSLPPSLTPLLFRAWPARAQSCACTECSASSGICTGCNQACTLEASLNCAWDNSREVEFKARSDLAARYLALKAVSRCMEPASTLPVATRACTACLCASQQLAARTHVHVVCWPRSTSGARTLDGAHALNDRRPRRTHGLSARTDITRRPWARCPPPKSTRAT